MAETTAMAQDNADHKRKWRRREVGVVASAHKTPQTLRVEVQFLARHVHYGKYIRRTTMLHAHDPNNEANIGDRVEVAECRPISKTKKWRLVRILERAPQD